jgi:hypothetical protein
MGPVVARLEAEGKVRARVIQVPSGRDKTRDANGWEAVDPGVAAGWPPAPDFSPGGRLQTGTDRHRPGRTA